MEQQSLPKKAVGLTDIVSLIKRSQKTGLDRRKRFGQLMSYLQAEPEDKEILEILEESLQKAEMKDLIDPDPFRATNPIMKTDLSGIIALGIIRNNNIPWLISGEGLTNHILIIGRAGGGKTNLILLILAQILEMTRNA